MNAQEENGVDFSKDNSFLVVWNFDKLITVAHTFKKEGGEWAKRSGHVLSDSVRMGNLRNPVETKALLESIHAQGGMSIILAKNPHVLNMAAYLGSLLEDKNLQGLTVFKVIQLKNIKERLEKRSPRDSAYYCSSEQKLVPLIYSLGTAVENKTAFLEESQIILYLNQCLTEAQRAVLKAKPEKTLFIENDRGAAIQAFEAGFSVVLAQENNAYLQEIELLIRHGFQGKQFVSPALFASEQSHSHVQTSSHSANNNSNNNQEQGHRSSSHRKKEKSKTQREIDHRIDHYISKMPSEVDVNTRENNANEGAALSLSPTINQYVGAFNHEEESKQEEVVRQTSAPLNGYVGSFSPLRQDDQPTNSNESQLLTASSSNSAPSSSSGSPSSQAPFFEQQQQEAQQQKRSKKNCLVM